jgi:hypothetical protein
MAQRKLRVQLEYRYSKRGLLKPGDHFRVRGGPVYVTGDGQKIPMGERGVYVFRQYCQRGADQWIEALSASGGCFAILWVGKARPSPVVSNLIRRPYRVRKSHLSAK